jgi:hypothetical protein
MSLESESGGGIGSGDTRTPSKPLSDDTWLGFLHSGLAGHVRPQRSRWRTWLAASCVLAWMTIVIALDVVRLRHALEDRHLLGSNLGESIRTIADLYQLEFVAP